MKNTAPKELTAKQIAHEEMLYDEQCARNNQYNVDEDESMLGFDVVGSFDTN